MLPSGITHIWYGDTIGQYSLPLYPIQLYSVKRYATINTVYVRGTFGKHLSLANWNVMQIGGHLVWRIGLT